MRFNVFFLWCFKLRANYYFNLSFHTNHSLFFVFVQRHELHFNFFLPCKFYLTWPQKHFHALYLYYVFIVFLFCLAFFFCQIALAFLHVCWMLISVGFYFGLQKITRTKNRASFKYQSHFFMPIIPHILLYFILLLLIFFFFGGGGGVCFVFIVAVMT